jgi:hypothetical protein
MRAIDPVCGMAIAWEEATDFELAGDSVFCFCCPGCAARYRETFRDPAGAAAHWTRLTGECRDSARRLSSGFRGVGIPLGLLPRMGACTLDEFEALVVKRWRLILGYAVGRRCVCRTVERAVLLLAVEDLDGAERHRIDVLIAAETARLRTDDFVHVRAIAELEALPAAVETTLVGVDADSIRSARVRRRVTEEIAAILGAIQEHGARRTATSSGA